MKGFRYIVPPLLLVALLALPSRSLHAQTAGAPPSVLDDALVQYQAKRGLDLLYDFRFEEAGRLFNQIDRRYPEHPIGPFLKALSTWWTILLDFSDTSHDDAFYRSMEEVIARSDRMLRRDDDDFDAMFFKGAALGFRGRLRSNRGDWFKSAMDGRKAMGYVLGVAERAPDNDDYVFGKGIYDYYAAVIPDRYPFTKPVMVFFPDGDRQRGLDLLERTAKDGLFIQTEAAYFLLQIYYLFERDFDKSVEYASWLRERHPNNSFFHTFEGRIYARWGRWSTSEEIFRSVLARHAQGKTGYNPSAAEQAHYFIGRSRMAHGDYDGAFDHFQSLDRIAARTPADTYFKVWGRLRQGMTLDALGRREEAKARYRQVLAMKAWGDVHDRAEGYLDRAYRGRTLPTSSR